MTTITGVVARDIRFPTSENLGGSDAMNQAPDYSAPYAILETDTDFEGHGLTSKKFGVPVCPHAGGVRLCEYVQHLSIFDYIAVGASLQDRILECVDHLHKHFLDPVHIENGCHMPPTAPGYSIEMKPESLEAYEFPNGSVWTERKGSSV